MKRFRVVVIFICLLFFFITFACPSSFAVSNRKKIKPLEAFQLHNGDRVVFLGNSLMEDDQRYGYIEFALTTRWPDKDVTFRNLGWSGDDVFAKARSYYTSTPGPYKLMIRQLKDVNPTVVFVAYGAVESYKGEKGLPHFKKGLNHLLDKIDSLGAKAVLLSPISQMKAEPSVEAMTSHNGDLKRYTSAISETASQRNLCFIDLFTPTQKISHEVKLSTDGVHLNELGYYYLTSLITSGLGLSHRSWKLQVDVKKKNITGKGANVSELKVFNNKVQFKVQDHYLPLPMPPLSQDFDIRLPPLNQNLNNSIPPLIEEKVGDAHNIQINGLDKGYYSLMVNGFQVAAASARKWSDGVLIHDGTSFRQSRQLRYKILKKNKQFFHQYRPLNRTYLIGFRTYEQGQNYKELKELDMFIERLEEQIAQLRVPLVNEYQLIPIE